MAAYRSGAAKQADQRPKADDRERLRVREERRLDDPAVDEDVRAVAEPDRHEPAQHPLDRPLQHERDRKSTRLNSSHTSISYAVFCLKKKTHHTIRLRLHCVHLVWLP